MHELNIVFLVEISLNLETFKTPLLFFLSIKLIIFEVVIQLILESTVDP